MDFFMLYGYNEEWQIFKQSWSSAKIPRQAAFFKTFFNSFAGLRGDSRRNWQTWKSAREESSCPREQTSTRY